MSYKLKSLLKESGLSLYNDKFRNMLNEETSPFKVGDIIQIDPDMIDDIVDNTIEFTNATDRYGKLIELVLRKYNGRVMVSKIRNNNTIEVAPSLEGVEKYSNVVLVIMHPKLVKKVGTFKIGKK